MLGKTETLSQQMAALANGSTTASFLANQTLERATLFADLNAFASLDEAHVLAQAEAATLRRRLGNPLSAIDGVPIAIKDNYLTQDYPTTACSNAGPLEPHNVDATIVANLRRAGAIIVGKTNMHEWAYGATNSTSSIGATNNPHDPDHITGGSSGGSAAAVAGGIVTAALGSDTGGSVRIPSSACGIYGFKPSYGRASRFGVLPLSWSLDAPGPLAAALEDIEHLLPYFLGRDPKDASTSQAKPYTPASNSVRPKLVNLTGCGLERADEIDSVLCTALALVDADRTDCELADVSSYFAAWETILHCEASSYHLDRLARSPNGYTEATRAHLEAGKRITAIELLAAQKIRAALMRSIRLDLPEWDVLVLPTLPVTAPRHGEAWQEFGGRRVSTQDSMTWFCWFGNLAGLPCLTIPVGKSRQGLPIGMMLMGKPGRDEDLMAAGRYVENSINGRGG